MNSQGDPLLEPPENGFGDDDDEAAREFGRELAMDALLLSLYQSSEPRSKIVPFGWVMRVAAVAVVLIIAGMGHLFFSIKNKAPRDSVWKVEPQGPADFAVVEPFFIRLESGELLVPSRSDSTGVTIETPHAIATTNQGTFVILTEKRANPDPAPFATEVQTTRIRVLSGVVTVETPDGTISGRKGDVLVVTEGEPPKNLGSKEAAAENE